MAPKKAALFPASEGKAPRVLSPREMELIATIERDPNPMLVIAATMALRDVRANVLPVGGGFTNGEHAALYAADVVATLRHRGMLVL